MTRRRNTSSRGSDNALWRVVRPTTLRRRPWLITGLALVLVLTGCSGDEPPSPSGPSGHVSGEQASGHPGGEPQAAPAGPSREVAPPAGSGASVPEPSGAPGDGSGAPGGGSGAPVPVGAAASTVPEPAAHLPLTWEHSTVVRPGWTQLPRHSDGLFLGFAAPQRDRATLRFRAVDDHGTVLWQADRPATCTGYALSQADGRPVAVLTDLRVDGSTMQTTASGYDLATGDQVWGPVPVPGSLQGPGLVFAAPAPASAMGATGPRVALDPATGTVTADERTDPTTRIVGEYHGVIVTADDAHLQAIDAGTGHRIWRVDNPAGTRAAAPAGLAAPRGTALVASGPGTGAAVIDLRTGDVLANDAQDAAFDALSDTYLVLGGDGALSGVAADAQPWQQHVPAGSRIAAAGSGLVYLVADGVGRVFNAQTGTVAGAYHPDVTSRFAVPQAISATGAAVFRIDGQVVLATASAG